MSTATREIPSSFPGSVLVEESIDETTGKVTYNLPEAYRTMEGKAEFEYFVERILSAINSSTTGYRRRRRRHKLSEIFHETDEAFALLMLRNEWDRWELSGQKQGERLTQEERRSTPKKFTENAAPGSPEGWSLAGRELYSQLIEEVSRRRATPESMEMETNILIEGREAGGSDRIERRELAEENRERERRARWNVMNTVKEDDPAYQILAGTTADFTNSEESRQVSV